MLSKIQSYWVVFFTTIFVVSNSILIANEFYWLNLLPIIVAIVLLAFLSLEYLLLIIAFCTPLSISLESLDFGGNRHVYSNRTSTFWGFTVVFFKTDFRRKVRQKAAFLSDYQCHFLLFNLDGFYHNKQ